MTDPAGARGRIGYANATSGYRADEQDRRMAILMALLPAGIAIESVMLPGPEFLDRAEDFDTAIAAAAEWATGLVPGQYDVLISAGALDPGLVQLRRIAPMPVIGPGEASLAVGAILARPLSIVTVDEHAVAKTAGFLDQTVRKPPIASVRSMDWPVRRIVGDLDGGREALQLEARRAVEQDGAEVIMLGAMTLGTLGVDQAIRDALRVPVINPLEAAVLAAVACVRALKPVA